MKIQLKQYPFIQSIFQNKTDEIEARIDIIKNEIRLISNDVRDKRLRELNLKNKADELDKLVIELNEIIEACDILSKVNNLADAFTPSISEIESYDRLFVGDNEIELND